MKRYFSHFLLLLSLCFPLEALTIAEKKESLLRHSSGMDPKTESDLREINEALFEKKELLKELYQQVYAAFSHQENFEPFLSEIKIVKADIAEIEEMWRAETSFQISTEPYALWHQPEATLLQLVTDYGASDFVYLIPPDIGSFRISISSNLPIPRKSWEECLQLILAENGVGIKQLNPFLKELYLLRDDLSRIEKITSDPLELDLLPSTSRICFVLTPTQYDLQRVVQFLQKFSNPVSTKIERIGGQIFILSAVDALTDLLKLYSFACEGKSTQEEQVITLAKIDPKEMADILSLTFGSQEERSKESTLRAIPLFSQTQSLFLSGSKEEVAKAVKMARALEDQIDDPKEKTIFWYTTKHSEAQELAALVAKVYDLLVANGTVDLNTIKNDIKPLHPDHKKGDGLIVDPSPIFPGLANDHRTTFDSKHIVVDPKTGAMIMVVEQKLLPKLKQLLQKLDVPKKMVQIEVLLFEKKITHQSNFGLNLLRIGAHAATEAVENASLLWDATTGPGILEFLISRKKGSGIPAYDLAYNFLLGQEDVQINSSPSILTVNQTPATIAVVDEISISTGIEKQKSDKLKESFIRKQYGITIQITPTINFGDDHDGEGTDGEFITLDTNITFDTTKGTSNYSPDVTRRSIKNHVRIADGQTVILGGLRSKSIEDSKDQIPFLGEIPGIGKLFGTTNMSERCTEMFVFITPKIISDPINDIEKIRREELKKRPGDLPELLSALGLSKEKEKKRLFQQSFTTLFGRETYVAKSTSGEEYNGKE